MQNHKRQDWNNLAIKTAHVLKSEGVFELKYLFSLEHLEIPMIFRKLSCLCNESVHYQTTKFTKIKIINVYCDIAGPLDSLVTEGIHVTYTVTSRNGVMRYNGCYIIL